jgi:hypothetical protein
MERQRSAATSRAGFATVVIGQCLVGVVFLVAAILVLSGAVTVAGWGEGAFAQRVVAGVIAIVLGVVVLAGAALRLATGRAGNRRAANAGVPSRAEDGYDGFGFGIDSPHGRHDGSSAHPGVGEF